MNKEQLMDKIKEIEKDYPYDKETSHGKVDDLFYGYIGFTDKELKLIRKLCSWYS